MILHQTVEEDLVLIPHGSEKGVFEDDGGLFLKLMVGSGDSVGAGSTANTGVYQRNRLVERDRPISLAASWQGLTACPNHEPRKESFLPIQRSLVLPS